MHSSKRGNGSGGALTALVMNRYWRAADATRVLEAWRRSGASGAAFARQHGLDVRRLLRWQGRLQRSRAPVFHPVRVVERGEPMAIAGTAPLELELKGGRRIRVHGRFDPDLLEELVHAVEGFRC